MGSHGLFYFVSSSLAAAMQPHPYNMTQVSKSLSARAHRKGFVLLLAAGKPTRNVTCLTKPGALEQRLVGSWCPFNGGEMPKSGVVS